MTDRGAIVGRMGKEVRRGEELSMARELKRLGIPIIHRVRAPATLEGGDVLWLDRTTVVVGHTFRTNDLGFLQFREALGAAVGNCAQVHLPAWKGPGDLLHLTSLIAPLDVDLATVHFPLLPIPLLEILRERDYTLVDVPPEEMRTKGCNVLALGPRKGVMVEGNTTTQKALEAEGVEVLTFPGQELCVNRGGGPTCLVLPILREV
jgi:N-dimethylarginine dimethylaminohydrolase